MKAIKYFLPFIILPGLFFCCRRELSFEGRLTKDANGNCLPVTINGIFKAGVPLTDTNYIDISADVTHAGNYSITTDTLNGIYFEKNSRFASGGTQKIRLQAHGTPIAAGPFSFIVHYDNLSSCAVQLTVAPPGPTTAVFSIDCAAGLYTSPHAQGIYVAGYPMNDSDKLVIFVHVNSTGTYSLSATTANGFGFSATGSFTITGGQFVTLSASGIPTNPGISMVSIAGAGGADCDFSIIVNPAALGASKMFYNVQNRNGSFEIYVANTDGTNEQRLTNFSGNASLRSLATQFSFNEDSTKIIFVLEPDSFGGDFMIMNVDGTAVTTVAPLLGGRLQTPRIFNNGQKLLYAVVSSSLQNGAYPLEIFTANIDGTNIAKLTSVAAGNYLPDGSCGWPSVNKADNTIVYNKGGGTGTDGIYTMNTDGSNKYQLISSPPFKDYARFSPDGTKIVFAAQVSAVLSNGQLEVFIMNADGSNITQLTNYSINGKFVYQTYLPVFSKDGKMIYYNSNESGVQQIYKMNIDGTGKKKITNGLLNRTMPLVN